MICGYCEHNDCEQCKGYFIDLHGREIKCACSKCSEE